MAFVVLIPPTIQDSYQLEGLMSEQTITFVVLIPPTVQGSYQ
jgi:hypothetical protein